MDNFIFKKENKEYSRTIQPIKDYIDQMSYYVSKRHGIPIEQAITIVKDTIKKKGMKIPKVHYQHKDDQGDIVEDETDLISYINDAKKNNEIIVPSFTTYIHPSKKKSLHSEFIDINVKKRSKHKKIAFKAKQENDLVSYVFNNELQKTMKILNNATSGSYGDKSTVLYNPSAHYTLTSITRCVASVGNAITESVVAGNKHLRDSEITYSYITSIVSKLNKNTIELAISKFNLYIPTVDNIMDSLIIPNISPYWRDSVVEDNIRTYLSKLEDYERVAVLYTNDLWTIKDYNPDIIRKLLKDMSTPYIGLTEDTSYLTDYGDGAIEILSKIINSKYIKGMSIDYNKLKGTEILSRLASTAKNILDVLDSYRLLFRAFLVTDILPISIAYLRDMLRSVIVLSDTDSTCGSYDQWVKWYYGDIVFSDESVSIASAVMTINSQLVDHGLKILANHMNIPEDGVELIKMKNEFFWPVFTVANVNKHYYASTAIQEGNVFSKNELELKGVHFLASNVDKSIVKEIHSMLEEVNNKIINNDKLSLYHYCKRIADLERSIIDRVKRGDTSIFKKDKIKSKEAYKSELHLSPYFHYLLWEEIFSESYGSIQPPPYDVIKIPTTLNSKKKTDDYISTLEEPFKTKLTQFLIKYNKTSLGTIRPPISIVSSSGIPQELIPIIDYHRIVEDNMLAAYYFLETLGIYKKEDMLISDMGY